jgi:hypothetical protein
MRISANRKLEFTVSERKQEKIGWIGGWQQMGITSWWSTLIVLPILIPFWTVGNRRWDDGDQD